MKGSTEEQQISSHDKFWINLETVGLDSLSSSPELWGMQMRRD